MDGYTPDDRARAFDRDALLEAMSDRVAALERGQRVSLRRIRRLPDLTATAIVQALGRRAMLLIGLGIAIGSALGGAGIEIVRSFLVTTFGR